MVSYPLVVEETHKHGLEPRGRHAGLCVCVCVPPPPPGGEFCVFYVILWRFFRVVLKTPRFITGNDPIKSESYVTTDVQSASLSWI
jgi:hypothetical protein